MKLKYIFIILMSGALLSSCTKNFEEINTNPNNPPTSDVDYIFNYVIKEGAGEYGGAGENSIYTVYNYTYVQRWIMQTAAVYGNSTMPPYTLFDQFRIQNAWQYFYSDLLLNCKILEKKTEDAADDVNRYQVARIWKIYCFHRVTDLWGDVPYSDAWQLLEGFTKESITPKYDTQEEIYADMLAELKEAASSIDNSKGFYTNDMIFDGDLDLWIKFANSLRLRLAVRSGNEAVVNEIISEGNIISDNSESTLFTYIETQDWWNPYYQLNINSKNPSNPEATGTKVPKISELMMKQLFDTDDPRVVLYAQDLESAENYYRGVPNLMDSKLKENQALGIGAASTSYIGRYFFENKEYTSQLLSHAEVCFLRAEAAFRGWSSENPQTWYENGVRSAFEYYEAPTELIDTFLLEGGAYDNTLEQIMTQKWIALYLNGWEAFAEYRRTGYPQLMKYYLELDGIKIDSMAWVEVERNYVPGRLPYPDDEEDLNNEHYLEAVQRQGGDLYQQQLWWSKKFGVVDYAGEY